MHRDIKPENIMIMDDEMTTIKLIDFGISVVLGPGETAKDPYGSIAYVAPEVLLRNPNGPPIDLWSLGIIMHLLLSGHLPFDSS